MKWMVCFAASLLLAGSARAEEQADPLSGLKDASPRTRIEAAWKLSELRTPEAEAAWVAALGDPARSELHFEAAARLAAFETLSLKARSALIAARTTKDKAVRLAVDVALGETHDKPGAMDRRDRERPGKKYFGIDSTWKPAEGAPTKFDATSLDGTLWAHHSPINILGEGDVTFVTLQRVGECLLVCTSTANHHIVRDRPPKGPPPNGRPWVTDWTLSTGLISIAGREWRGPNAGGRPQRVAPSTVLAVPVGLVLGRLAAPALVRTEKNCWKWTGRRNESTFRFDGGLVPGKSGEVRIRIHPRAGADVSGVVDWRVEMQDEQPYLKLGRSFPIKDGIAVVSPHEYMIDVSSGAAAALGRRYGASATYVYAGKL